MEPLRSLGRKVGHDLLYGDGVAHFLERPDFLEGLEHPVDDLF